MISRISSCIGPILPLPQPRGPGAGVKQAMCHSHGMGAFLAILAALSILFSSAAGAQTGTTYNVDPSSCGVRDQLGYVIAITAGTATWVLEGRNDPNDTFVQVATGSASASGLTPAFRQLRVRLTAATGGTVRASVNAVLRP